ncbi:MAG: hypothetical protein KDC10_09175 [Calditrichaeota bacterium]|nr:hypothetical protein [Candidatus Cloacimonadota bacterium]MCB1047361.1 hypothetical protein [Calditrichota bacterium]MCB9475078.1 hypothetical protein [Candidatus Delongbacteria bacterium]
MAGCAERQDQVDADLTLIGSWNQVNDDIADISVGRDQLFVASNENRGFLVFNRSEEGAPRPVATYRSADSLYAPGDVSFISSFLLADSLLFLKLQTNLLAFNVSNPYAGSYIRPFFASGVNNEDGFHDAAGYQYLVYCDRSDGILVQKFSDRDDSSHPDPAGRWFYSGDSPPPGYRYSWNGFNNDGNDLATDGNLLYLANGRYGLSIMRFNGDPVLVDLDILSTLALPGDALRLSVQDGLVVVALGGNGFAVVDASDPSRPYLKSVTIPGGTTLDVSLDANHAVLANSSKGVLIYDLRDPARPRQRYRFTSNYARRLRVTPERIYVADRDDGLLILANPLH